MGGGGYSKELKKEYTIHINSLFSDILKRLYWETGDKP